MVLYKIFFCDSLDNSAKAERKNRVIPCQAVQFRLLKLAFQELEQRQKVVN